MYRKPVFLTVIDIDYHDQFFNIAWQGVLDLSTAFEKFLTSSNFKKTVEKTEAFVEESSGEDGTDDDEMDDDFTLISGEWEARLRSLITTALETVHKNKMPVTLKAFENQNVFIDQTIFDVPEIEHDSYCVPFAKCCSWFLSEFGVWVEENVEATSCPFTDVDVVNIISCVDY
jgi:hypothetical protein